MPMLIIGGDGERKTGSSFKGGLGSKYKEDGESGEQESSEGGGELESAKLFKKAVDRGNPRLIKEAFKALLADCQDSDEGDE